MTLYVKEYEWMWNDLRLSLAECRVYAYTGFGGYLCECCHDDLFG